MNASRAAGDTLEHLLEAASRHPACEEPCSDRKKYSGSEQQEEDEGEKEEVEGGRRKAARDDAGGDLEQKKEGKEDGGENEWREKKEEVLDKWYLPTPLPPMKGSEFLLPDVPPGEGWDEAGNDISAIRQKECFRAARDAHINGLEAEAAAIRDGSHPEFVRRRNLLEGQNRDRKRAIQRRSLREHEVQQQVYNYHAETIAAHYDAAIEKTQKELLEQNAEEAAELIPASRRTPPEVMGRMTRGAMRRAEATLDDHFQGNLFNLNEALLRKSAPRLKFPLVRIGLKVNKGTIKDDTARLRASIDEDSTAATGRSPSRHHGVARGQGDGCSGGSSAYGGRSILDPVGSTNSPRRKRDDHDFGDVSAKRLRNEISGGGSSGGISRGGGALRGGGVGRTYSRLSTPRSGAVVSTVGSRGPSRKRLRRDADDFEEKALKRNRHEKSGSDDGSASREEGSSSDGHSAAHGCDTTGNESGDNATSADNESGGESSVLKCRGSSGVAKHHRKGSG